ncbi:Nucleoredoxin-like protein 2 [Chelonia mydas]|uniref:Nucleoredoxin-like protein 2 n=1 Tax=Chelonia mydas TaxID=8469 RepID=M7C6V9_CHEMY|nr:Nucleoredoxin-like protein 2 [Chelonia mydas]
MVDVFSGRPLLTRDGHAVDPEEVLQNKIVGLYFSAGWCSPCRDFTPVLDLKKKYNITAIPKLVIVKQTGEVITDKGRKQIKERGLSCFRNWLEGADVFQNFSN